jgi:hypothetical protein
MFEPANTEPQDLQMLDRILNQQSEISRQIRKIIDPIKASNPGSAHLDESKTGEVGELMLELEVLQAEERALLNRLFPGPRFPGS